MHRDIVPRDDEEKDNRTGRSADARLVACLNDPWVNKCGDLASVYTLQQTLFVCIGRFVIRDPAFLYDPYAVPVRITLCSASWSPSATMSCPRLPPEISDHIVDLLRGDPKTLKICCLVSKSWVARARRQLFCDVDFNDLDDLKAWKKTFPDPGNSPALYTRWLWIGHAQVIPDAFAKESGWVQAFSNVVWLSLWNGTRD